MRLLDRPKIVALAVFLLGIVTAFLMLQQETTRQFFHGLENDGYLGAFVAGVMYAISFTSPLATVIFTNLSVQVNVILAAVIGGIGALLYDLLVFSFARRNSHSRFVEAIRSRIPGRNRIPSWAPTLAGMVILASPLPDELAAGMLGLSSIPTKRFFLLSFTLNTIGIFILLLFR